MRLLAYRSVHPSVPCVFWKFEVRECLGLKIGGGGTAFPCVLWHFNHFNLSDYLRNAALSIDILKRDLKTFLFAQY